jgi:hypothetical protein
MRLRSCRLVGRSTEREGSVWRSRGPILFGASVLLASVVPIVVVGGAEAAAAADPTSVETACPGTGSGTLTFTLTADCDTTVPLTVPDGVTLNGAGHTITAHDITSGSFDGAVLSNAGTSMNIGNLTIMGTGFITPPETAPGSFECTGRTLNGIWFNGAGGSVTTVTVTGITENSNCQVGRAIVATGTAGQTVTITDTTVSGYNKAALVASGSMTMNVTGSTLGPPDNLGSIITQNGVQYSNTAPGSTAGAGGTISGSTIFGSGFGVAGNASTAMLLFGADGVTVSGDTFTGAGTDKGISVTADSTGIEISHNHIARTSADSPDSFGIGVGVDAGSSATLICNTFSGWMTDIVGATQALCVTTASLPAGSACHAYPTTTLAATSGTPPYSWSVVSVGKLPPGLTLSALGVISGTPTTAGTFPFTVQVADSGTPQETATQALSITVAAGCVVPTTTTSTTVPKTTTPTAPVAPITASTVSVTG